MYVWVFGLEGVYNLYYLVFAEGGGVQHAWLATRGRGAVHCYQVVVIVRGGVGVGQYC